MDLTLSSTSRYRWCGMREKKPCAAAPLGAEDKLWHRRKGVFFFLCHKQKSIFLLAVSVSCPRCVDFMVCVTCVDNVWFCVTYLYDFDGRLCDCEWEGCACKSRVGGFNYNSDEWDCTT